MKVRSSLLVSLAVTASAGCLFADVRLPAIISDHMVLEKAAKVPIWGVADSGEEVSVTLDGRTARTTAGADGKWMIALDLKDSSPGPFEMTVEGKNKLKLEDVLVGEVWVASGQSNMEWVLANTKGAVEEIAQSTNPLLRQFLVKKNATCDVQEDCEGAWVAASPQTSGGFTAVGYYFAKKLQSELKVPVGLVHTSWGGTPSEAWTSVEAIDSIPELKASRERIWKALEEYPKQKNAFIEGMEKWTRENGREDSPVAEAIAFSGMEVSADGWVPVTLPGLVRAPGLPESGAVWLRKEIEITNTDADCSLQLPIDGYDSIYWNGHLVKQTGYQDFPGTGYVRRSGPYTIKPIDLKKGKNVLAIRLYEPVGPAKLSAPLMAGSSSLGGEWMGKPEYEFPALDAQQLAAAPQPPLSPVHPQNVASYLFNGMVTPILPYAIRGVIWYQGESNAGRAVQYRTAFPLLITDWRKQWNQGDFSFYFCQLANFMPKKTDPGDSAWAELREAQSMTLALPNTGQAVLIDIGESDDIHPRNKKDAGERLALIALAKDYGKKIPFSGPVYDSMRIEDGKAILHFKSADGGLVAKALPDTYTVKSQSGKTAPLVRNSPGSQLEGFAICGEDRKWVWADARIDGDNVIVRSDQVPAPVAVRYAWADNPTCNLSNGTGLPVSPFRTDDFPPVTKDGKY